MKFRIARHTDDLNSVIKFYTIVLGLEVLGEFKNHNHYDGVFIGKPHTDWHLEFTCSDEKAVHQFDEDDLLVFYPESLVEFDQLIQRFKENEISAVKAKNPLIGRKMVLPTLILMDTV